MKKILFICNEDWFFISHRLPIGIEALNKGYEVHVASNLTGSHRQLLENKFKVHKLNIDRCKINLLNSLKLIFEILKLLKEVKPNIIHAITIKPVLFTGIALKFYKKAALVASISGLGYVFIPKDIYLKIIKIFVKISYKFALSHKRKKVIFQNKNDSSLITKICKLKSSEKTLINGSGVDLEFYKPLEKDINTNEILFASRLLITKGILEFIESAKELNDKKYKFIIAGKLDFENPDCISIEQLRKWESDNYIKYLGEAENVRDLIRKSKIVVLPSYYGEGLPKILIEAAACGKPVITTNHPGCRDAILPNKTGLLIPIKNSKELSIAINKLFESPKLYKSMSKEARKLAIRKFDIKMVIKSHMEIYSELM